jgi:hypothetical protein
MKRLLYCGALFLCIASVAQAQGDAKAIVTKALQAAGMPMDNKPYHESWKEVGKMTAPVPGGPGQPPRDMTVQYESFWAFEAPDKFRFDMKGDISGMKIELAFIQNGKQAVEAAMGRKQALQGPKLEETTHSAYQFWVCSLRPLLNDSSFTLTVLGDKEFGGKPVTSVKVSREGNRDVTLHFDKKTGLLAGCSDRIKDEFKQWKEVAQDTEFGDYAKSPSGEMFFRSMTVKRDGKVMLQSTFSDYKRSETLQPDKFKLD